jgi:hypothetical protein
MPITCSFLSKRGPNCQGKRIRHLILALVKPLAPR